MEHIREYLISVTAAALLCGILRSLAGEKGAAGGILKLVSGIFLMLTVIRPLENIRLREFTVLTSEILSEANAAAREGEDYASRAMARHIKEQAEAYILDKAGLYDLQLTVEVTVSGGEMPVPESCTLQGRFSAYTRKQLSQIIEDDLGIRKEAQHWISEIN